MYIKDLSQIGQQLNKIYISKKQIIGNLRNIYNNNDPDKTQIKNNILPILHQLIQLKDQENSLKSAFLKKLI